MLNENIPVFLGNGAITQKKPAKPTGKRIHDAKAARITLKQWRIFHAVHDFGGFTEAGERLHLTQSTVSYAVARMQEQLGIALFELVGRTAVVTPAGRALLTHSRYLLREATELEKLAWRCAEAAEETIDLLVESDFPPSLLDPAVDALARSIPSIRTELDLAPPGRLRDALRTFSGLAISSAIPEGYVGEPLTTVQYVQATAVHPPGARAAPPGEGASGGGITGADASAGTIEAAEKMLEDGLAHAWVPSALMDAHTDTPDRTRLRIVPDAPRYDKTFYLVRSGNLTHCTTPVRVASVLRAQFGNALAPG